MLYGDQKGKPYRSLNPLEEQIRMFWKAEFGLRAID